jgi:adenine deaminase
MGNILLKNGRVIDVIENRIEKKDIAISGRVIALPDEKLEYDEVIDLDNAFVGPGFIDGHLHIESSMLSPVEFSFEAVKHGTTSIFVDPHEIANVLGRKGVELFLDMAPVLPLEMNIGIPSCVPATHLETSGGEITLTDIEQLLPHPCVYGLAEMMNFPGIIHGLGDARRKVDLVLSKGKIVDGHCPGLSGKDLEAYISNGKKDGQVRIGSDHECTGAEEALEKMEKGMYVMLRQGSSSKDLENILPEVARTCYSLDSFGLVSDDLSACDLKKRGHINHLVSIAAGIIESETENTEKEAAIEAIAMATLNHARYFGKNTGKIEPGADADIIVFNTLSRIEPDIVLSKGNIVVRDKKVVRDKPLFDLSGYRHSVILPEKVADKLMVSSDNEKEKVRIIKARRNSLVTGQEITEMEVDAGVITPDPGKGIHKIAVIERHKGTGNISVGFVKGFEFTKGAIAGTVAHDSHNLIVVGTSEVFMIKAIGIIRDRGGGIAVVSEEGEAYVPLALAGLMSTKSIDEFVSEHERLEAFLEKTGFKEDPFPTLSFMALPVIPELKITDKGLVDVATFDFVDLFVK